MEIKPINVSTSVSKMETLNFKNNRIVNSTENKPIEYSEFKKTFFNSKSSNLTDYTFYQKEIELNKEIFFQNNPDQYVIVDKNEYIPNISDDILDIEYNNELNKDEALETYFNDNVSMKSYKKYYKDKNFASEFVLNIRDTYRGNVLAFKGLNDGSNRIIHPLNFNHIFNPNKDLQTLDKDHNFKVFLPIKQNKLSNHYSYLGYKLLHDFVSYKEFIDCITVYYKTIDTDDYTIFYFSEFYTRWSVLIRSIRDKLLYYKGSKSYNIIETPSGQKFSTFDTTLSNTPRKRVILKRKRADNTEYDSSDLEDENEITYRPSIRFDKKYIYEDNNFHTYIVLKYINKYFLKQNLLYYTRNITGVGLAYVPLSFITFLDRNNILPIKNLLFKTTVYKLYEESKKSFLNFYQFYTDIENFITESEKSKLYYLNVKI
jgi:hypothetical protein